MNNTKPYLFDQSCPMCGQNTLYAYPNNILDCNEPPHLAGKRIAIRCSNLKCELTGLKLLNKIQEDYLNNHIQSK